jgi:[citrate (pro-3S)-lyase] ligase
VVPSGNFILSNQTFPEYFVKIKDDSLINNIKYDLSLFGKYIAPNLNIKYRFVGEELNDEVTLEYNKHMKEILPKYNIKLIEIPRKKAKGSVISASHVRELIKESNYDELNDYLPKSTIDILFEEK